MNQLMDILAILAYMPENIQGEENSFTAEFMILLRKQVTHPNIRTRCFGVLGTIAAVKQLAIQSKDDSNDSRNEILIIPMIIYLYLNAFYIFYQIKLTDCWHSFGRRLKTMKKHAVYFLMK